MSDKAGVTQEIVSKISEAKTLPLTIHDDTSALFIKNNLNNTTNDIAVPLTNDKLPITKEYVDDSDSTYQQPIINNNNCSKSSDNSITISDDTSNERLPDDSELSLKCTKPTTLKLNVIVTDTDNEQQQQFQQQLQSSDVSEGVANKTKKFYESDDAFIQTIFSQTITSTTVTPTDEELSYSFDTPFVEGENGSGVVGGRCDPAASIYDDNASGGDGRDLNKLHKYGDEHADTDQDVMLMTDDHTWITIDDITMPVGDNINETPSNNESQTENLENYNETMISFTDTICLDQDCGENDDEQDMSLNGTEYLLHNEEVAVDCNMQQPRVSIVIDCYNDAQQKREGPYYVEPTTPEQVNFADASIVASYFHQTIDDNEEDVCDFVSSCHENVVETLEERDFMTDNNCTNDNLEDSDDQEEDQAEDEEDEADDTDDDCDEDDKSVDSNHCLDVHVSVCFLKLLFRQQ